MTGTPVHARAHPAARADRIGLGVGLIVGVPLMVVGAHGIWTHRDATPIGNYLRFFIGGDVLHDFVVAPFALVIGYFVVRRAPAVARPPLRAALFGSAVMIAIAWPGIRHYGRMRTPDNPSVQPLNSATATLTVVGVVVALSALWLAIAIVRDRNPEPSRPQGDPPECEMSSGAEPTPHPGP